MLYQEQVVEAHQRTKGRCNMPNALRNQCSTTPHLVHCLDSYKNCSPTPCLDSSMVFDHDGGEIENPTVGRLDHWW